MFFDYHQTKNPRLVGKVFDVSLDAVECAEHFFQLLSETLASLSGEHVRRRPHERGWLLRVDSNTYAVGAAEVSVGLIQLVVAKCPGGAAEIPAAVCELMQQKSQLKMLTIEFDERGLTATERAGVPTWIPQPIAQSELSR